MTTSFDIHLIAHFLESPLKRVTRGELARVAVYGLDVLHVLLCFYLNDCRFSENH